jgi:dephospho-CoA kinase
LTADNQLILENFIYAQLPEAFREAYLSFGHHEFIVYDVPLLFEKHLNHKIDTSICTYSPRAIQVARLVKRDHISVELAEKILSKQMDIEEKNKISDLFIENIGDLTDLKNNFDKLLAILVE